LFGLPDFAEPLWSLRKQLCSATKLGSSFERQWQVCNLQFIFKNGTENMNKLELTNSRRKNLLMAAILNPERKSQAAISQSDFEAKG
jgi:hypothetical protein